jgi:hypothetical protein
MKTERATVQFVNSSAVFTIHFTDQFLKDDCIRLRNLALERLISR